MKIGLDEDEIFWCRDLALRRSGSMNHADTVNSFNMGFSKAFHRHWCGVCGELVFSKYSGFPVDTWTIGKGDDGTDFEGGIQVKSSWTKARPNLLIPPNQWDRKPAQRYVLVWVKRPYSFILGEISRELAKLKRQFIVGGTQGLKYDTFFIDGDDLGPLTIDRAEGSWEV